MKRACLAIALSQLVVGAAYAASIQQTNSVNASSETAFGASSSDLLNFNQSSFKSIIDSGYSSYMNSQTAAFNDGSPGLPSSTGTDLSTVAFDLDGTWTSTFNFNLNAGTGGSPLGYSLTQIQSTAGWTDERADQDYTLSYSTIAAPNTFIPLGTFTLDSRKEADPNNPTPPAFSGASEISLTENGGPFIASGVAALQFSFMELNGGNSGTVYREIDVFGSATIPEPASILLGTLGVAGLGLATRFRRGHGAAAAACLALATALGAPSAVDGASIIANGSFEDSAINVGSGSGSYYSTVDSTNAWTLTSASIISVPQLAGFGPVHAEDGNQFAVLNVNGAQGTISQTFATQPNQLYAVTFYQNQFYDSQYAGPSSVQLTANVANAANSASLFSQSYTFTNAGNMSIQFVTDPVWAQHTFDFVATGSSTTLSFVGQTFSPLNFGQAIDNVSVTAVVPEPASLLLLTGSALVLGLAFVRRGRRQG